MTANVPVTNVRRGQALTADLLNQPREAIRQLQSATAPQDIANPESGPDTPGEDATATFVSAVLGAERFGTVYADETKASSIGVVAVQDIVSITWSIPAEFFGQTGAARLLTLPIPTPDEIT